MSAGNAVGNHAAVTVKPERPLAGSAATLRHGRASTYDEILSSTLLIGGSTLVNVVVGITRAKVMAVLLGPAGFGLMGVFSSVADLARGVVEMGINSSGVRQIAASVASGDTDRIARTVHVLRRTAVVLGLLGASLLVLLARQISTLTFGTEDQAAAVALLGAAVFLRLVADGQGALIQGMRRVSDMVRIGVLGSLLGALLSIVIVYFLRADGVAPSLVGVSATAAAVSWWYSRKIRVIPVAMSGAQMRAEVGSLLKLGLAFMASGLLTMGAAYIVRLLVLRQDGLAAAGYFQAAWTLGGVYVGFVLQAMGADFYPRLVGSIADSAEANRLVNEQAHISLLLAGPGVIATLTLAPLIVVVLYSSEFAGAVNVLRWVCLGMALRVITWPMGYITVAKNQRALFFAMELAWTGVNVGLAWYWVQAAGLEGAGMAFFGSYVFHAAMVYAVSRRLTSFRWSNANLRVGGTFVVSIATVFGCFLRLPQPWAYAVGAAVLVLSTAYSTRELLSTVPHDRIPAKVYRLFVMLRLVSVAQGSPRAINPRI